MTSLRICAFERACLMMLLFVNRLNSLLPLSSAFVQPKFMNGLPMMMEATRAFKSTLKIVCIVKRAILRLLRSTFDGRFPRAEVDLVSKFRECILLNEQFTELCTLPVLICRYCICTQSQATIKFYRSLCQELFISSVLILLSTSRRAPLLIPC
jgi:hypothetical protein